VGTSTTPRRPRRRNRPAGRAVRAPRGGGTASGKAAARHAGRSWVVDGTGPERADRTWTWARVPFGPTRRRPDAVDVPLSTGRPGPSQVVSPRRPASRRLHPEAGWSWHPLAGAGARSVDPGQPEHGVAPSYAERPCGGRRGT